MTFKRSLAWVVAQFLVVLSIELAALAVLARALTPIELGWFAAALAVIEFARFLGAVELHTVIVRTDELDLRFRRHVMALALGASSVIAIALVALLLLAPVALTGEVPRQLLFVMLPTMLLHCYAMTGHAMLLRERRFEVIFFLKLASTLAFVATAVPLALSGVGAFAMAWGLVSSTAVHATLACIATKGAFLVIPSIKGSGTTTRLAGTILVIAFTHHATLSAVPFLIGRLLGFATLGQFARAEDFIRQARRVLEDTIMPALIPFVFDAARDDGLRKDTLRPKFVAAISNLTAVAWPATALVILLSAPIVSVLLGDQWTEVPLILQILAVGFLAHPMANLSYIFAVALRCEAALARFAMLSMVASIGAVLALWPFGLEAVCIGVVTAQILHAILRLSITMKNLDLAMSDIIGALAPSFLVTLFSVCILGLCTWCLMALQLPQIFLLLGVGILALPVWMAALYALHHPLAREIAVTLRNRREASRT